ncbi:MULTISPECIES: GNAT family N-acetyltransferase [unclassified Ensifer]|uniref:GNAT family N-acetyltransferase n=1 Tax=unclassified Ensifer TaxID=2633371 RepID=UPI0009EC5C53|nr:MULTISPECIES: GNAT family N-acetyltransferase [unclassified Ensifer]
MKIDIIDTLEYFEKVREDWDLIYLEDPEAHLFLSWEWLQKYLSHRHRWFILALKQEDDGRYCAFLPLKVSTYQDDTTKLFCDEIRMAGNYGADYTGFLCRPGLEDAAADTFSAHIGKENWTTLTFDYFSTASSRLDRLLGAFPEDQFVQTSNERSNPDNIDNTICPYVNLPESWEDYLATHMSAQTRQKLRRFMRMVEASPDYRITHATKDTIERDLDTLFRLWRIKWAERKGSKVDRLITFTREMLLDAFNQGALDVPVLWYQDQPLGVLANLLDRQKKTVLFCITGRDETWTTPSPGLLLHGFAIRNAIAWGYRVYDFLRGNEAYKYSFGVEERRIRSMRVKTRSGRNLRNCLNPRSIEHVYERAVELHSQGRLDKAEPGYRQVIHTVPTHTRARYGLAQLFDDKGEHDEAEYLYRSLLATMPGAGKIQHRLGDSQMAQGHYAEAAETFEALLARHPLVSLVRYKLGVALCATGRGEEALSIFSSFEDILSDDPDHVRCKLKAQEAVIRLKAALQTPQQDEVPEPEQTPVSIPPPQRVLVSPKRALDASVRLPTAPPLLQPSLPSGISAHLQSRSNRPGETGSRIKH